MNRKLVVCLSTAVAVALAVAWLKSVRVPTHVTRAEPAAEESAPDPAHARTARAPTLEISAPVGAAWGREPAPGASGAPAPEPGLHARDVPDPEWRRKYDGVTVAEMLEHESAIETTIAAAARPELDRMLAAGEYDVVGTGSVWHGEGWDPDAIQAVAIPGASQGEIRRAALPRQRFTDLYELRAESRWLRRTARRQLADAATPDAKTPR